MTDCIVIGGGVIGLSIAYELARHGQQVQLFDRQQLGHEASRAGAGILPAPARISSIPAWKKLQAMSYNLHAKWSEQLAAETGVHTGYRVCGGLHVAHRAGEAAALRADACEWAEDGVIVEALGTPQALAEIEPQLEHDSLRFSAAYHLPEEAQIRNPHHLAALLAACRRYGVEFVEGEAVREFRFTGDRITGVVSESVTSSAEHVVLAAGAWTEPLLKQLKLSLSVYPVRGQIVLYRCDSPPIGCIINEGPRYLVPRDDGRLLVGSTEEDVGFDKQTTDAGVGQLRRFAEELLPCLHVATVEKTWAGLRPHAVDGFPYIGRAEPWKNCFVAAGHYRSGLTTSTGTAVLIRQLILGQPLEMDVREFRLDR